MSPTPAFAPTPTLDSMASSQPPEQWVQRSGWSPEGLDFLRAEQLDEKNFWSIPHALRKSSAGWNHDPAQIGADEFDLLGNGECLFADISKIR